MKSINSCQISIIFIDNLPNSYDFIELENIIKEFSDFKGITPLKIPGDQMSDLPAEIPRLTYNNKANTLQISPLSITWVINDRFNENEVYDKIGNYVAEIDKILNYISEVYRLKYRVGIVLQISMSSAEIDEMLQKYLKDPDLVSKPEIEFSFLEVNDSRQMKINTWKRYYNNKHEKRNNCVVDVNLSLETPAKLGVNSVVDVYQNEIKNMLEDGYNGL